VRLTGPIYLAQIACFPRTQFSSDRTGSTRRETRSLRRFLLVRSVVFLLGAALFPTLVDAQTAQTVFHFSKEVHWGHTILPPGDYVVTSLDVKNTGAVLTFATPRSQPRSPNSGAQDLARQQVVSGESQSADRSLFTIRSPQNQTIPYAKAQTIYLSACRVVEQEFSRTTWPADTGADKCSNAPSSITISVSASSLKSPLYDWPDTVMGMP